MLMYTAQSPRKPIPPNPVQNFLCLMLQGLVQPAHERNVARCAFAFRCCCGGCDMPCVSLPFQQRSTSVSVHTSRLLLQQVGAAMVQGLTLLMTVTSLHPSLRLQAFEEQLGA